MQTFLQSSRLRSSSLRQSVLQLRKRQDVRQRQKQLLQQLPHRKQKSHRVMKAMMTTVKMIVRTTATVQIQMFSMTRMETL